MLFCFSILFISFRIFIRKRFDDDFIAYLLDLKWWDWEIEKIESNFEALSSGDLSLIKNIER